MSGKQTKKRIFDESVKLFSKQGYAGTGVRQIAEVSCVNEATIYIHFKNKAEILDEIFTKFEQTINQRILAKEDIPSYIEKDGPRKFLSRFLWNSVIDKDKFMRHAFRIVCMEQYKHQKAGELVLDRLSNEVIENLLYVLDKLIEDKKISAFDTYSFAVFWAQIMFSSTVMAAHTDKPDKAQNVLNSVNKLLLDIAISGGLSNKGFRHSWICDKRP